MRSTLPQALCPRSSVCAAPQSLCPCSDLACGARPRAGAGGWPCWAGRVIAVFVGAWRMLRRPPKHIVSAADHQRWAAAVRVTRLWVLKSAINTQRISNQRLWQHRQLDDGLTSEYTQRQQGGVAGQSHGGARCAT